MKIIHCYYSNIPCQGRDCKYWGGEYTEEKLYPVGYNKDTGIYSKELITSIWHGEHCNRSNDLAQLRKSIYDRALKASDAIHKSNKYKLVSMAVRKAGEAFDKIADEWRNMKCPFYEKVE